MGLRTRRGGAGAPPHTPATPSVGDAAASSAATTPRLFMVVSGPIVRLYAESVMIREIVSPNPHVDDFDLWPPSALSPWWRGRYTGPRKWPCTFKIPFPAHHITSVTTTQQTHARATNHCLVLFRSKPDRVANPTGSSRPTRPASHRLPGCLLFPTILPPRARRDAA
jgi:hypothetical protein